MRNIIFTQFDAAQFFFDLSPLIYKLVITIHIQGLDDTILDCHGDAHLAAIEQAALGDGVFRRAGMDPVPGGIFFIPEFGNRLHILIGKGIGFDIIRFREDIGQGGGEGRDGEGGVMIADVCHRAADGLPAFGFDVVIVRFQ